MVNITAISYKKCTFCDKKTNTKNCIFITALKYKCYTIILIFLKFLYILNITLLSQKVRLLILLSKTLKLLKTEDTK
ncbi:hypothetical protein ANASTE_00238 [Anaerofustis stercorihominis DSM 17244]|uniref:Uncharacterized protein n=1 Tax=Anaerofustis stercorihominis DSM 17244 TaxID=445971 RepID=B1C698_9FIRM|nr:hypothetical protein ANASTE_00238 [Anaerofustis stercorihominis DSM 17244]